MGLVLELSHVRWHPSWRVVSSRFPPEGLFDRVSDAADLDVVIAIEGLTNDRLRQEAGDLSLVAPPDRIFGPGTTPIMAAFTHPNPEGSRFATPAFGVYYAANSIDTAIEETRFHKQRFLRATNEAPIEVDMRSYAADLDATMHDLRGQRKRFADVYDAEPANYGAGQSLSASLRVQGSNGLVYDSVRDPGGECVAVFKPKLLSRPRQGKHYCYVWDGQQISQIYIKSLYRRR